MFNEKDGQRCTHPSPNIGKFVCQGKDIPSVKICNNGEYEGENGQHEIRCRIFTIQKNKHQTTLEEFLS